MCCSTLFILILLLIYCGKVGGLFISQFNVPATALRGEDVTLWCHYKLEMDTLYSLTWWKDDQQFFRYKPGGRPEKQLYDVQGVKVDTSSMKINSLTLVHVGLRSTGKYRCEVLADAPSYEKHIQSTNFTVVEQPRGAPRITGIPESQEEGDLLLLNCTSPPSHPPANISWTINSMQPVDANIITYPRHPDEEGRSASLAGLQMQLQHHHFKQGMLVIGCEARIFDIFLEKSSRKIPNTRIFHAPQRQEVMTKMHPKPPTRNSSSAISHVSSAGSLLNLLLLTLLLELLIGI